jgi:hypothetical protein
MSEDTKRLKAILKKIEEAILLEGATVESKSSQFGKHGYGFVINEAETVKPPFDGLSEYEWLGIHDPDRILKMPSIELSELYKKHLDFYNAKKKALKDKKNALK